MKKAILWTRRVVALGVFAAFVALFAGLPWMWAKHLAPLAKVQFWPAMTASIVIAAVLIVVTILFGRCYCSVLCPLGILQDIGFMLRKHQSQGTKHPTRQRRVAPGTRHKAQTAVRLLVLVAFLALYFTGLGAAWIEPYGLFGRIMTIPLIGATCGVAILALAIWRGRVWCNWACPVGTILGGLSRFAPLRLKIDKAKCVGCRKCERGCRASAIEIAGRGEGGRIDPMKCIQCRDCTVVCPVGAIGSLQFAVCRLQSGDGKGGATANCKPQTANCKPQTANCKPQTANCKPQTANCKPQTANSKPQTANCKLQTANSSEPTLTRREFIIGSAATAAALAARAADEKIFDGGYAEISDPGIDKRNASLKPAGAHSIANFAAKCVGCQLCVKECPNHVLRPSMRWRDFGQPEMAFDKGFCTVDCSRCSHVCPAGAIEPIPSAMKKDIHIGEAVWHEDRCIAAAEGVNCTACYRHCPVKAIERVKNAEGTFIPVVDADKCIGCGACEHVCPARPLPGMTVKAYEKHREVWPMPWDAAIDEARHLLENEGYACVVVKEGAIVGREKGGGVLPLLKLLDETPEMLKGGIVVDKVIGRAAAAICAVGGVSRVVGLTVSDDAAKFLADNGIGCDAVVSVPRILNRDRSGICPMEAACEGLSDPAEMVAVLRKKLGV